MSTFKEKGVEIIKCQNSKMATRESIKNIHRAVNKLLYDIQYQNVLTTTTNRLYGKLVGYGQQINKEAENKPLNPKEAEILQKLRNICINLRHIIRNTQNRVINETLTASKVQSYSFWYYKQHKDEILKDEETIKNYLEKLKTLVKDLQPILNKEFDTQSYLKIQNELIEALVKRYVIWELEDVNFQG